MSKKPYDAERSIGSLITDLSRLVRRTFNRHLRDSELTQSQWQAIAYLRRWQGINQVALAELMEIQPITLARLIDRMAAAGWVERRPDPRDRRAVQLFLTDKAQPILANMRTAGSLFEEQALAGIDELERQQLIATLGKIKANLASTKSLTTHPGTVHAAPVHLVK
ncbi:MAG TPA: MarR family transcriptional regulator [Spongiibacteraceae bacterium]|nr:MarR family transcriptional regulator [Spongiibacteraceae bacterium]